MLAWVGAQRCAATLAVAETGGCKEQGRPERRGLPTFCKQYFRLVEPLLFAFPNPALGPGLQRCAATLASRRAAGVQAEGPFAGTRLHGALQRGGSWAEGASKRAEGGALSDQDI
ncbi:hypothetical protein AB664_24980 [Brucella anthropi]|uniref:Uncharacterized protein n=1 Tax=Brucella anthropi TaxID=529 RepID=A0A656Z7B2_BRUAN|nr:hypothetical protein AB664_24980 [Brucella anthropi]